MVDAEEKDAVGLDPKQLLKALGGLLDPQGGARGVPEILRIASLMKDAKKLVARCVYASILKCTTNDQVMEKFVQAGGWETLNIWLQDAKAIPNTPFIEELLQVYQNVPVTIELLKQNNCAKTIKQMSKSGEECLIKPCTDLVESWMETVKTKPAVKDEASSDMKKSKHSKSSSDRKHKHHSSSKAEKLSLGAKYKFSEGKVEKSKISSTLERVKNSFSKPSSKSDIDRLKGSTKSLDNRRISDTGSVTSQSSTSSQVPSASSQKPLVTYSKSDKLKSVSNNKASSVLSSANISDKKDRKVTQDNANKAKTAKTAPTKFRSTGNGNQEWPENSVLTLLLLDFSVAFNNTMSLKNLDQYFLYLYICIVYLFNNKNKVLRHDVFTVLCVH